MPKNIGRTYCPRVRRDGVICPWHETFLFDLRDGLKKSIDGFKCETLSRIQVLFFGGNRIFRFRPVAEIGFNAANSSGYLIGDFNPDNVLYADGGNVCHCGP